MFSYRPSSSYKRPSYDRPSSSYKRPSTSSSSSSYQRPSYSGDRDRDRDRDRYDDDGYRRPHIVDPHYDERPSSGYKRWSTIISFFGSFFKKSLFALGP